MRKPYCNNRLKMLKPGTDLFLFQYASLIIQKLEMSCKRGTKWGQHNCGGARGMKGNSPVQAVFGHNNLKMHVAALKVE